MFSLPYSVNHRGEPFGNPNISWADCKIGYFDTALLHEHSTFHMLQLASTNICSLRSEKIDAEKSNAW
jgi:hypothetical protein